MSKLLGSGNGRGSLAIPNAGLPLLWELEGERSHSKIERTDID